MFKRPSKRQAEETSDTPQEDTEPIISATSVTDRIKLKKLEEIRLKTCTTNIKGVKNNKLLSFGEEEEEEEDGN